MVSDLRRCGLSQPRCRFVLRFVFPFALLLGREHRRCGRKDPSTFLENLGANCNISKVLLELHAVFVLLLLQQQ